MLKSDNIRVEYDDSQSVIKIKDLSGLRRELFIDSYGTGTVLVTIEQDEIVKGQIELSAEDIHNLSTIVKELELLGVI